VRTRICKIERRRTKAGGRKAVNELHTLGETEEESSEPIANNATHLPSL